MADQQQHTPPPTGGDHQPSTVPKPTSLANQPPGSQVPFPSLIPGGVFSSPNTEKQVSDLLAEMQQYSSTAAPGTTTTMQFSYSKSKHTSEKSGEEPKVHESSNFEKAIHQTPPTDQQQHQQQQGQQQPTAAVGDQSATQGGVGAIFSQIPQFLQDKLGFGGARAGSPQSEGSQSSQVSYQHSKKTTTTTTTSTTGGGDQGTVTTTDHQHPFSSAPVPTPTAPPAQEQPPAAAPEQQQQQSEGGFFDTVKTAAEKLTEQVGHIPQLLQETFGGHSQQPQPPAEGGAPQEGQEGEKHVEMSYQHSKKTTTTTSTSSSSNDLQSQQHQQQQPQSQETGAHQHHGQTDVDSLMAGLMSGFPQQGATPGNVHMEMSKHASRQVTHQSGNQAPEIETTSSGYTQVVQGIFNGVPIVGSVVPVIVPVSVNKSSPDTLESLAHDQHQHHQQHQEHQHHHDQQHQHQHHHESQTAAPPPPGSAPGFGPATTTAASSGDATAQLEEQLKKLGLTTGHPVSDLLQQTLAQHQRAKTPESNIEIQYSAQRTHSTRTVTYEAAGNDTKSAHEALQQLQGNLSPVAPPSQSAPEPPPANNSQQSEMTEGSHVDEDGNLVITKKVTRVTTTTRTVYDESGQPHVESSQSIQGQPGDQHPPTQG